MSSGIPEKSLMGIKDSLTYGLESKKDDLGQFHPLERSEKNFRANQEKGQLEQLRKLQGIHAPFRIQMERRAFQNVGHLPCITQRSNFHDDVLTGRDEMIGFDDVLGRPENFEGMSMPHLVIEKKLGML